MLGSGEPPGRVLLMPLRVKALFAVGATFVALFLGLYLATRHLVLAGFREYEDQEARRTVQRVLAALHDDLVTLKDTTRDWAGSDALRGDAAAVNNRIGLMVVLDPEGRVVVEKACWLVTSPGGVAGQGDTPQRVSGGPGSRGGFSVLDRGSCRRGRDPRRVVGSAARTRPRA